MVQRCVAALLVALAIAGIGCEGPPPEPHRGCVTGASAACACTDGRNGAQVCLSDGTFGPCVCTSSPDPTPSNRAPFARAGPDQFVRPGAKVTLNGSLSNDPDGESLKFIWFFQSLPNGTTAALIGGSTASPTFTADVEGTYVVGLLVNDGATDSAPDTVSITALRDRPVANAGPDQTVLAGSAVSLDGGASTDADGASLTYRWSLLSLPEGSAAMLSDTSAVEQGFTADREGSYFLSLVVNNGRADSDADTVVVWSVRPFTTLGFRVADAEYSRALDRVVAVSTYPSRLLHVTDPESGSDVTIALPANPTAVSVGPDGRHAVVGHDGFISYVDLDAATVLKTVAVSADVLDVVLAGNGYAYAFPRLDRSDPIRCVNLTSGEETLSTGAFFLSQGTLGKLHPDGTDIYGADNGVSPSDIHKFGISGGTAERLYDSPYHGTWPMCGDLWIADDGQRIFTRCGHIFRASSVQADDMIYASSLSGMPLVKHLDHSSAAGKIVGIVGVGYTHTYPQSWTPPDADAEVRIYETNFFNYVGSIQLPRFIAGDKGYVGHGRFAFIKADGTRLYVVLQADGDSGMLNDFGLVAYDLQ